VIYAEREFILELALNLGWLAISIATFGFFGFRFVSKNTEHNRAIAAIALVCLVCLLFPVVSMTDDLNSSPAIPEATKLKKLLADAHFAVCLFSHVLIYAPSERIWANSAFEQEQKPAQQELLSFDLSRRPPPQGLFV
jgi:hypothetical protein